MSKAKSVVVLTGAGISAESGIPTFRGEDGLWKKYRAEELATPWAFEKDPNLVWEWYDWRRGIIHTKEPNPAHHVVTKMEEKYLKFTLVTQNVDGLHKAAGTKNILEIHGCIWRVRCLKCKKETENFDVPISKIPPECDCGGILRPGVVWFGESLPSDVLAKTMQALEVCDLLFVIGTSAYVQPAASFPIMAKQNGAYVVEINKERTPLSDYVDTQLTGPAGKILPELERKIWG
ncbi:NAD-dependent deacylase [bacterium]|nr:NAD-dependent deacylase [bacterium]